MAAKEKEIPIFIWEGADRNGNRKKGEVLAKNSALAKAQLRREGINVLKIKPKPKPLFGIGGPKKKAITPLDIAIFSRQLATMMKAGVPLVQSFEIVGNGHENANMSEMILAIKADVEGGSSLTEALRKFPLHFDDLYCNLVQAGEHTGILDSILDKVATYKEKTEALKAKIKKAMFYPIAVMVVAVIVITILLLFVIPQFEDMFSNFGASLPAPTQFVVDMSRFLQEWWWAVFGSAGLAIFVFSYTKKRSRKMREGLDKLALKMAIIGPILEKAAVARYARTLQTMFAAGTPLVEALGSVSGAVGNIVFSNAVDQIQQEVSTGTQLNKAMTNTGVFPNMVLQMTAIGEESGALDTMLGKVADFYEAEVDNLVDGLTSLLEPIIMSVLGVIIGGIVVAMYLPIFQMGAVV
ncbi:MAG: type II secretion system F family protein [gamma proteobacterium symbiont of Bathyaustriella thionipta]|nr:type II secretion system F family protein [gamma proteobacterium symbiont of Bathyaustriella thionipta]MCU7948710.1 type II secretion system F family protein [gamma proteobacterium symbiont of Bathyaustriella thionipta]MCU7953887.1 type II secretion system F family protein [gamma proteobacterium symbiont of Bathyaustriella thionipta]MCU7955017.1 type II secretion system F family protein [gamma proteobacterium symbiont of Bathyaustriella thionipta]MCU7966871.1 type II secretion system F famil